jgi:hypothetical protein
MSSSTPFLQNLDTTFVNLWSLLRKLTQQGFIGRVHVELPDYSADIFLDGSSTPLVREVDRSANTEIVEAGALHRVVLRTRETPGVINVFAGAGVATAPPPVIAEAESPASFDGATAPPTDIVHEAPPPATANEAEPIAEPDPPVAVITDEGVYRSTSYDDWPAILVTAGELISAVERGVNATGHDFTSVFGTVRLELADDYVFLDPFAQTLHYANGVVSLKTEPAVSEFIAGLSEALRRTINLVAVGDRARRVRERIALEMFSVARRRTDILEKSGWRSQLDRIAGTAVM